MNSPSFVQPDSLSGWLTYLESIHPASIDMGLERVKSVYQRLKLDFNHTRVVTVGGTNGKGSTSALIEHGALLAGNSVGVYSSPHILDYRERVRINGQMLPEQMYLDAFNRIEQARGEITLTYFEFGTLAALLMLHQQPLDLVVLEVGLGGRLDAVNVVDADLAVITTIDIDHQDYLGSDREVIGFEKAGILRKNGIAVIGEPKPPRSLLKCITNLEVDAWLQDGDFGWQSPQQWRCSDNQYRDLPQGQLPRQNISTAMAVLTRLGIRLSNQDMALLITRTGLPGRCQWVSHKPGVVLDVAHNPQSVAYLAEQVGKEQYKRLFVVCGMLKDKDMANSLAPMQALHPHWYLASLQGPRGASASLLASWLDESEKVIECDDVASACRAASQQMQQDDLLVVFGSFFTVADAMGVWTEK